MKKKILASVILLAIASTLFYACKKEKPSNGVSRNYKAHIVPLDIAKKVAERIPSNYF